MKSLRSILNIDFLVKEDALKNWRMILFLSALAVIMISSGHSADNKIFKIAALNTEIKALKSDFIEAKKQLLVLKKESTVTRLLADKGLRPATQPPIKITVTNE
jgi:chemotaxis response regulator CheB